MISPVTNRYRVVRSMVGPPVPREIQELRNSRLGREPQDNDKQTVRILTEEEAMAKQTLKKPAWLRRLEYNRAFNTKPQSLREEMKSIKDQMGDSDKNKFGNSSDPKLKKLFDPDQGLNLELKNELMKKMTNLSDKFAK
ncbi:hypothetical protein B5S30_g2802 [[Candida] boidinii]|nr:hypothetical protein B5S30_g2802 [[Candida] boidinii]